MILAKPSAGLLAVAFCSACVLCGVGGAEENLPHRSVGPMRGGAPDGVERAPAFDPEAAGWELVFEDNFEADSLDRDKWSVRPRGEEMVSLEGGRLVIKADYDESGARLVSGNIETNEVFLFGYFEARVSITKQPGWWAAFWLNSGAYRNRHPFLTGFEIDIFEDYFNRVTPEDTVRLDHNLHVDFSAVPRRWRYVTDHPASRDGFYVLGLKWTPFEISYYLNGELIEFPPPPATGHVDQIHKPYYDSVTFDAFNHIFGITPMHVILSGQVFGAGQIENIPQYADPGRGEFPENFFVDYIKVYEYPADRAPRVEWSETPGVSVIPPGEKFTLKAVAEPSPETGAKIERVYLFDSGFFMKYTDEAPYAFEMAICRKHYDGTSYMRPGRDGAEPELDGLSRWFIAAARDSLGNVGYSEAFPVIPAKGGNAPYRGKAQTIPGILKVGHYDEGGCCSAFYDTTAENVLSEDFRPNEGVDVNENMLAYVRTGEWIKYTVDVAEEGLYNARVSYGTPYTGNMGIRILLNGIPLGKMRMGYTGSHSRLTGSAELLGFSLPAGKHVLTLIPIGSVNFGNIEFKKASGGLRSN